MTGSVDFDYVIVGAGSAGCVLAARLSENPAQRVLLLEAGPEDRNRWIHIPIGFGKTLRDGSVNWLYRTEPDPATALREVMLPRGKVLGGSSSINGHVVTRGLPQDYDAWAAAGNSGWDFAAMLPYFRKIETAAGFAHPSRGHSGPVNAETSQDLPHLSAALVAAAAECGLAYNPDYNSGTIEGIAHCQRSVRRGLRDSAAKAYLHPIRGRSTLVVECGAQAERIHFAGRRAVGVDYRQNGVSRHASARGEVILAAGAIGSPHLLELSGIGDVARLQGLGVDVLADLPGVGENLQDHFLARSVWKTTRAITFNERARGWRLLTQIARFGLFRTGLFSAGAAHMLIFARSEPTVSLPDLELTITPFSVTQSPDFSSLDRFPALSFAAVPLRPRSRGSVHAGSANPAEAPAIRPAYLAHEQDQRITVAGLKLARQLIATAAFSRYRGDEVSPGADLCSDDELLAYARNTGLSIHHAAGSCAMGPAGDRMAVVGADLRVHGLDSLRVVDASIMPALVSGHTNFPTLAIAEKAADLIIAAARRSA
jgi:choline dehydrogenase